MAEQEFVKLELRTAYGPIYRDVSTRPPRDASVDEIPIIDLTPLDGDLAARTALAEQIKKAATNTGFFYVKNHGIPEAVIEGALNASKAFFAQSLEKKQLASKNLGKWFNGYSGNMTSKASPTEGWDIRESFSWRYEPQYDPEPKDPKDVPAEVWPSIRGEQYVWDNTSHVPNFKEGCIAYWQACLTLARKLVRIFALCLDLPEDYFDSLTVYPGADGVFNYYPAMPEGQEETRKDIGLGSHTDLQCFTLLWQDMNGGLQVLNNAGEWIKAQPVEGTFVVNIADYLQRLSNDKLRSTVHRVYNRATVDRYSMPFFYGFQFDQKCGVLPTCTSADDPPKYEPISCGDWCQLRFQQVDQESKNKNSVAVRA
jgi:isopenicillin N synthase-like dioxygenase